MYIISLHNIILSKENLESVGIGLNYTEGNLFNIIELIKIKLCCHLIDVASSPIFIWEYYYYYTEKRNSNKKCGVNLLIDTVQAANTMRRVDVVLVAYPKSTPIRTATTL